MANKKIMVCLDGSKSSTSALRTAILFARQYEAIIVGVHSNVSKGSPRTFHNPTIKKEDWSDETKKIMDYARKKCKTRSVHFEEVVLAGHNAGYDLARYANNKRNKIDQVVIGSQGIGYPRGTFFGSVSNFVLHKAKIPVTVVK